MNAAYDWFIGWVNHNYDEEVKDTFLKKLTQHNLSLENEEEIIEYMKKYRNHYGLFARDWISDYEKESGYKSYCSQEVAKIDRFRNESKTQAPVYQAFVEQFILGEYYREYIFHYFIQRSERYWIDSSTSEGFEEKEKFINQYGHDLKTFMEEFVHPDAQETFQEVYKKRRLRYLFHDKVSTEGTK